MIMYIEKHAKVRILSDIYRSNYVHLDDYTTIYTCGALTCMVVTFKGASLKRIEISLLETCRQLKTALIIVFMY